MKWGLLPVSLLAFVSTCIAQNESFDESLALHSLQDGKLLSQFHFRISGPSQSSNVDRHHQLLPGPLLALLDKYGVASLSLTLSNGRYLSHWPTPTKRGIPASGVELLAYLLAYQGESPREQDTRWQDFQGALSGLFCTGLLDAQHSSPHNGFKPNSDLRDRAKLYRVLTPRLSAACTESLTPFLSLLPCRSRAGLASLLNPFKLFDGDWTLLGLHYSQASGKDSFDLEVGSVIDPVRHSRLQGHIGKRDFSLSTAFDRPLEAACPVASSSILQMRIPTTTSRFTIEPAKLAQRSNTALIWDIQQVEMPLDVSISFSEPFITFTDPVPLAPISVRRLLHGVGQERGKIGVQVVNHLNDSVAVDIVETWDWWLRPFLSQLSLSTSGPRSAVTGSSLYKTTFEQALSSSSAASVVELLRYVPAIARERPTTLELRVQVPPNGGSVSVLVPYESAYLWYTEYSSDAHRGVEVRGAKVSLRTDDDDPHTRRGELGRGVVSDYATFTSTTLVSLPTPDFSMPYNVIILTSTVVALFFGNVVNRMLREWRIVDLTSSD